MLAGSALRRQHRRHVDGVGDVVVRSAVDSTIEPTCSGLAHSAQAGLLARHGAWSLVGGVTFAHPTVGSAKREGRYCFSTIRDM